MKRFSLMTLLAVAPLLTAAMWMDRQPSPRPYQAPVLSPPVDSVPVSGKELLGQGSELTNPIPSTSAALERGLTLFEINCAMCHGISSAECGPVGKKLVPPPPGLGQEFLKNIDDAQIFKAISLGFGRMPPFSDKLTPTERWELVNVLRTRK